MRKYLVHTPEEYQIVLYKEICLDDTRKKVPKEYPCLVIVAYLGEGWDELCFVYNSEIKRGE